MDTTTNYGMNLPGGGDTADQTKFNENTAKIDTALGSLGAGLAIIANRNSHAAIAAGDYVYIRNHTSLSEGLYKARSAIAANATLSTSNVEAADGSLNSLSGQIGTINSTLNTKLTYNMYSSVTDLGIASGVATIADVYAAMVYPAIGIFGAQEFDPEQVPLTGGYVRIEKATTARARIFYYHKTDMTQDAQMALTSGNVPSGTWVRASS